MPRPTRKEQWAGISASQREVARFLWDYGHPLGMSRELVAMGLQGSSLGVHLVNPEDSDKPFQESVGIIDAGVKWAAIRDHGTAWQDHWHDVRRRLMSDWGFCARHAVAYIEDAMAYFGPDWWWLRIWAYWNGGPNHWRKPGPQQHAENVYRWWLAIGGERP